MAKRFPLKWNLTPIETAYLTTLKGGKVVSKETLAAFHGGAAGASTITSQMARLRRKLDPLQIEIDTLTGQGWRLDRYARARLNTLLAKVAG